MKVAVTGASGLTGSLVVRKLQERGHTPLAVVRSQDKADELCASYANLDVALTDVTGPGARASLETALGGADALIICTSAKPKLDFWSLPGVIFGKMMGNKDAKPRFSFPAGAAPRDVDYEGTRVQIAAAKAAGVSHVVLLSSMAGTLPEHFLNVSMDKIVLWKRRAEMELIASGLEYTVIHPGGLLPHYGQKEPAPGGQRALVVGVDDALMERDAAGRVIPREDVAALCVLALDTPEARGRSFDVVSSPPGEGAAFSGDMAALLSSLSGENCDYSRPANLEELLG
ncbi:hypothetical protein EMIHUDRAFT_466780 [Emiliania huxleyi CCMP1516]|uniref:NAD(P)-binding domain-containing protein n=2 Tax=Emiliania huxleyi TaxID=2903 RepID=A0A0D3KSQ1_EMIH1|nr:hypothetical protein EMIHUDRAFT_466780 [Emiliania huxleyi CCMP1516]EOD38786.1 hypothetical protein EMIHUDRAFT_466780 [Emiliania huxleyi CCMP1516]|eukprot:XP_005791215.1 hypothetical protein EMIHUDRAFT_466780 [Emiliania huxleyi CCMP1516]